MSTAEGQFLRPRPQPLSSSSTRTPHWPHGAQGHILPPPLLSPALQHSHSGASTVGNTAQNKPRQGPEASPGHKVLEGPHLEMQLGTPLRFRAANICWPSCASPGWVRPGLSTEKTHEGPISPTGNHSPIWNPVPMGSGNGPALVAKGLRITWELHTAYRPQGSRKEQHTKRTLKLQLTNCQEPSYTGTRCCQVLW